MKKRSNSYWERRSNSRMAEYHKSSDKTIDEINKAYEKAIADINEDINKIFYKFASDGGLSLEEARELLNSKISKKELESIRNRIYSIQDKDLKRYMMAKLNAEAYKARITRLEALKESIYINIKAAAEKEINKGKQLYTNNIKKAYYTNIFDIQKGLGIGFNVAEMPDRVIQEILNTNWSGNHFSKRVWHNTDVLAQKLEETMTSGLMSGKSYRRMAEELEDLTDYGKHAAERVIRTETTYVTNKAEIESYKECDIDKYIFLATLDLRTSKQCREKDGKKFDRDKAESGTNLPPLHPNCRSTTRAYFEGMERLQRRARDPDTGKTYIVPGDMNYQEWHDKFVVNKYGKDKTENFEKMIKNKSSDRKQYNKYKEVLGKDSPKTLKDFQDLKYNNSEDYKDMKAFVGSKQSGKISHDTTFKKWKDIEVEANNKIVGAVTPNGIRIEEVSSHMIERFIGDGDNRIGVSVDSVRNALTSPLDIKDIKIDDLGRKSQKFIGENATVSINPDTGNLIQTNPTSSKLAERLKRRKANDMSK